MEGGVSVGRIHQARSLVTKLALVSLFADFTYEGGRALIGPYLALLGAGPFLVGVLAGTGELLGYLISVVSSRYANDRGSRWTALGSGYGLNLLALPALAWVATLPLASALILGERLGKGLRNSQRDTLLKEAGHAIGEAEVFGRHAFFDQTGTFLGPVAVAYLTYAGGLHHAFLWLALPAAIAILLLGVAARRPLHIPIRLVRPQPGPTPTLGRPYWIYLAFSAVTVAGFSHFILISYHLVSTDRMHAPVIALLYALATIAAVLNGQLARTLMQTMGLRVLSGIPLLVVPAMILLYLSPSPVMITLGAVCWGGVMGVQSNTLRAGVLRVTTTAQHDRAYKLFDATFALAWMGGTLIMGVLSGLGSKWPVIFAGTSQVAALPLLFLTLRQEAAKPGGDAPRATRGPR